MTTVDIPDALVASFKKFKTNRKFNRAYIMKVNKELLIVEEEAVIEDVTDLTSFAEEELPEGEPRFVAYTTEYETKDGRKTYPLVFIFFAPPTSIALNTLYASTKQRLINALQILKIAEIRDKDEFTNDWLKIILAKN